MSPFIKTILRDLGIFIHLPGFMALLSLLVCLFGGEYYGIWSFTVTAIASFALGQLLYQTNRHADSSRIRHSIIIVALAWAIVPLLGAIPFFIIANHLAANSDASLTVLQFQEPLNAIFEAFSGFTSTGLSVALKSSELPLCLQWWRSFMEWIGGVGVIVLILSILEPSADPYQLYSSEGRSKTIGLTIRSTVRKIWWVYILYTLASIILLRVAGMPWWDALNHGLTGISTGGFSIADESIGAYGLWVKIATIPIMIFGAISFPNHYRFLTTGRLSALWKDSQHRVLWILLVLGTLLLLYFNYSTVKLFLWVDSTFQWASALGTCGFNTVDIGKWSESAKLLLSLAMVVGGATGSTVGGLKIARVISLWKGVQWSFRRIRLQPYELMRYQIHGEVVSEQVAQRQVSSAAVLAFLWVLVLFAGIFILVSIVPPDQYSLSDTIFEAASALGSVGLSVGITGPDLAPVGRLILILFMWMGRLEIIPVLLLIRELAGYVGSGFRDRKL